MTEETVSATVGMSATVGEMSETVGEMSETVGEMLATVGKFDMVWEIKGYRLSFITLHTMTLRIHGITCKKAH